MSPDTRSGCNESNLSAAWCGGVQQGLHSFWSMRAGKSELWGKGKNQFVTARAAELQSQGWDDSFLVPGSKHHSRMLFSVLQLTRPNLECAASEIGPFSRVVFSTAVINISLVSWIALSCGQPRKVIYNAGSPGKLGVSRAASSMVDVAGEG